MYTRTSGPTIYCVAKSYTTLWNDAGAEMAAVYLSVVSTVKLAGKSVWRFFWDFFEDMVTGGKKHISLLSLLTT